MAKSASFRLSMAPLLSGRCCWPRAGSLAVTVALQDFLPDGFLHRFAESVIVGAVAFGDSLVQRVDDGGLSPLVKLLHEALWFFLFGHIFVPFGKRYFFGSGQLAL